MECDLMNDPGARRLRQQGRPGEARMEHRVGRGGRGLFLSLCTSAAAGVRGCCGPPASAERAAKWYGVPSAFAPVRGNVAYSRSAESTAKRERSLPSMSEHIAGICACPISVTAGGGIQVIVTSPPPGLLLRSRPVPHGLERRCERSQLTVDHRPVRELHAIGLWWQTAPCSFET